MQNETEWMETDTRTGGKKGQKIERYDLIPTQPLRQLAQHYGIGAQKYADRNWELGYDWSLSYAAAQRHLNAFWGGDTLDEEGNLHLAAAAFHIFALMEFSWTHLDGDNRPKPKSSYERKKEYVSDAHGRDDAGTMGMMGEDLTLKEWVNPGQINHRKQMYATAQTIYETQLKDAYDQIVRGIVNGASNLESDPTILKDSQQP